MDAAVVTEEAIDHAALDERDVEFVERGFFRYDWAWTDFYEPPGLCFVCNVRLDYGRDVDLLQPFVASTFRWAGWSEDTDDDGRRVFFFCVKSGCWRLSTDFDAASEFQFQFQKFRSREELECELRVRAPWRVDGSAMLGDYGLLLGRALRTLGMERTVELSGFPREVVEIAARRRVGEPPLSIQRLGYAPEIGRLETGREPLAGQVIDIQEVTA